MKLTEKLRKEVAEVLDIEIEEIETELNEEFDYLELVDGSSYNILTDEQADYNTKDRIRDMVWAFNVDFLTDFTGLDSEVFEALKELSENSNKAVLSLIEANGGIDQFVKEAVQIDGRGHFLNYYDGEELELPENDLYMYREE